ncbi:RsbRD N-terminal domain-containing protein [Streptomyces spectabilis]|uniref:RsbRD N-terminal domain-containing protein n=1 Tax=Streptomyces spectabilis TaxID=68270 RepID=UPI0033C8A212
MSTTTPPVAELDIVQAARAFARGGEHIDPELLDVHLVEVADKASCSLLRDRFRNDFPHAAYHELLSSVAALRAVLGFSPTPTAREVLDWQDRQRTVYAEAVWGPKTKYPVVFTDGPYRGVEMALDGPAQAYPSADDPLGHLADGWIAGPPAFISLPIVWGDTNKPGHSSVGYKRGYAPGADGLWPFRVRTDDPAPPTGARPHITVSSQQEG